MVAGCIDAQCDNLDTCGEPEFIERTTYACGFDSVSTEINGNPPSFFLENQGGTWREWLPYFINQ